MGLFLTILFEIIGIGIATKAVIQKPFDVKLWLLGLILTIVTYIAQEVAEMAKRIE